MESGEITNAQISASTEYNNLPAIKGRLNEAQSWSAQTNDVNQVLIIDFGYENTKVTGVATQGRGNSNQWVTKYKLEITSHNITYFYKEPGQNVAKVRKTLI